MWTARLRTFAVASFLVFVASAPMVRAQEAHTGARPEKEERTRYLTNADVVRMVKAGVEEDAIIASIQSSKCRFLLTPEALLALNKDGVKEKVLRAMIDADERTPKAGEQKPEVAKADANRKRPKLTPAQKKIILARLRARHSKPAPIKSAPKMEDTDQRVAALKQQKEAVKSGQVRSASGGAAGQGTTHAAASGGGGGTGNGMLLSSGSNQAGGQNTPRPGTPIAGGTGSGSGGGLLSGSSNPPNGQNQARGGSAAGGRASNSSGGHPSTRTGASGSGGGSGSGTPNGGGTLLASNNPPAGGGTPAAGTSGAAGSGTGGNNPLGGSNPAGSGNPTGGGTPASGTNPNPNNPSGANTPRGGQPSFQRTAGTASRNIAPTAMLSNAPVAAAVPPSSNPPSPSSMAMLNTQTSIDPCMVQTAGPIIKGLNSSGSYGPAVFTQDPNYNPFWVIGCHFGNTPGSAYLNSSTGQLLANFSINSWTDTLVKVSLDPSLVDVFDQENVTLVIAPPSGPSGQKGGFSFYALRKEVLLTSMPKGRIIPASITDDGGVQVLGIVTSPYQGFGFDVGVQGGEGEWQTQPTVPANVIQANNLLLSVSGQGYTAGVDRNSVNRFNPGNPDRFDFSHLKPGFVVSRFQLQDFAEPICYDEGFNLSISNTTYYSDGTWNAQLDSTLQQISVSTQESHCHDSNGTDSSSSAYALNVWVSGPAIAASESPWMPGLN